MHFLTQNFFFLTRHGTIKWLCEQPSNKYCSTENPHTIYEVPLHDLKIGDWCEISAERKIQPVSLHKTINPKC